MSQDPSAPPAPSDDRSGDPVEVDLDEQEVQAARESADGDTEGERSVRGAADVVREEQDDARGG